MRACKSVWAMHGRGLWTFAALLACAALANGQRYEITPLFAGFAGGSMKLQEEGQPLQARANLGDSAAFGLLVAYRFYDEDGCEDCSAIGFRWMRQNTHVGIKVSDSSPLAPTPLAVALGRPAVTLDHYLGDFVHEWPLGETPSVRPFVMATVGATRMITPVTANTRFTFGIGAGVKIFPRRHWGFRFHAEYLPMVMHSEVQRVTCVSTCVVALNGGVLNQFEIALGPVFRF